MNSHEYRQSASKKEDRCMHKVGKPRDIKEGDVVKEEYGGE
jgi:hypothetical protein